MEKFIQTDEWNIIEKGFHPEHQRKSESLFSLGNGRIGQRGNFEEGYGNDCLPGSYVAGIFFPDRTKVGWWKNGYPHFFTRLPNAPDWSTVHLRLMNEELDLSQWDVKSMERRLDMEKGIYHRSFRASSPKGHELEITVEHVNSMARQNLCIIRYNVKSVNYEGKLSLLPLLNGNVVHESANFNEKMWNMMRTETTNQYALLWAQAKQTDAQVCLAMSYRLLKNNAEVNTSTIRVEKEKIVGFSAGADMKPGDHLTLEKYTSIVSTVYCDHSKLMDLSVKECLNAKKAGYNKLIEEHTNIWKKIWKETDVVIEGDREAQQGIRFNIFQLNQSYRGDDPRLNIGPKGFTGEKYGGNTQWNTELCCVPYFLLSCARETARNLLLYRYNQLPKAIENASKLGFGGGAALYPMVTSNGEECHNEWEITFEEVHRNNIIVHVIRQFITMTGRTDFMAQYGLEMIIAIARFWSQRVSFSQSKEKYVILGVTGPDEYENNVDNNWYTNYSCVQVLKYALYELEQTAQHYPDEYDRICKATTFSAKETLRWKDIIEKMYLPADSKKQLFVQDDSYMDKELMTVDSIPDSQRPVNQHWSWDRILRSCFLKQSDVLLGMYLFHSHFDKETIARNFHFYEPRTLHESSLSPFIHSILAARIGDIDKAYQLFLHATRLDLDDYNNELAQGLHITSMPGSWLALVEGFAGMEVKEDILHFNPVIPKQWQSYSFKFYYRDSILLIKVTQQESTIELIEGKELNVRVNGKSITITQKEI